MTWALDVSEKKAHHQTLLLEPGLLYKKGKA